MSNDPLRSEPPKPKRKRRKRHWRKREDIVFYEMRISAWNYYYGLRVSDPKSPFDTGLYSELAVLTFSGSLVGPAGHACTRGVLKLSASEGLMKRGGDRPPTNIGMLTAHAETLEVYVFVPAERLAELTALAPSNRVQVATIVGSRLRYRSGSVQSISVNTEIEPDE